MDTANTILERIKQKDPYETEFHQAVREIMESIRPVLDAEPETAARGLRSAWSSLKGPSYSACRGSTTKAMCKSTGDSGWR